MREHPWHLRRPSSAHFQWFRNLLDLNRVTVTWIREIAAFQKTTPHQLKRVLTPGLEKTLDEIKKRNPRYGSHLLDDSVPRDLSTVLDHQKPEVFLSRLEESVWALQASTLALVLDRTESDERSALQTLLEQSSWRCGRTTAEERWGNLPAEHRQDLRSLYFSFQNGPLSLHPDIQNGFILRRATPDELELELLNCPHESSFRGVKKVADTLCPLHSFWARGYLYELNHLSFLEFRPRGSDPRCQYRWSLREFENQVGHA